MKVAKKSPEKRSTLTVTRATYDAIGHLAAGRPRSAVVDELVSSEMRRRQREALARRLEAEYTGRVCQETLELNAKLPVYDL